MRPDIVAGAVFPEYELYDHTSKRIECSLLAGTFSPREQEGQDAHPGRGAAPRRHRLSPADGAASTEQPYEEVRTMVRVLRLAQIEIDGVVRLHAELLD